jgi:hypothetical protein
MNWKTNEELQWNGMLCIRYPLLGIFDLIFYWEFNGKKWNWTWNRKTADKLPFWNSPTIGGHCTLTMRKNCVQHCKKNEKTCERAHWLREPSWEARLSQDGQSCLGHQYRQVTCNLCQPWMT